MVEHIRRSRVELLAPCHDWPTLVAAVLNGANAVYFGVLKYNMRMAAKNFQAKDLPEIVNYCHSKKVKCYLTLNTIIYEDELKSVENVVKAAKIAGIDALIVSDLSVIELARKYNIPFHVSTQVNVSNSESANFFARLGAKRVILARECTLKQIKSIVKNSKIGVELFVHGALCISVSGRCFFSESIYGKSANRGECLQPCRQKYTVIGEDGVFYYEDGRFLNSRDLCMIEYVDKLLKLGVVSFKIEGRMRDADYVGTVVKCYHEAIDNFSKSGVSDWKRRLGSVFNRGFCTGFYFGSPKRGVELSKRGNVSRIKRVVVGCVLNYYPKNGVVYVNLNHAGLNVGDEVLIEGKTTSFRERIGSIYIEGVSSSSAKKGSKITFKVSSKARRNDQVYVFKKI
ncbi:Peptidase family U32 [Candidatus Tiddalikarchaeum anstoanum]|nr:Peptidase family U32 [Candidatus Tiddalikarchaeum anstoanum]